MTRQALFVNFFIDCESTQKAIDDLELGNRSSSGFAEILEKSGLKGTFYLLPSEAEASSRLYLDLQKRGHEIGIHVHPSQLGDYEEYLGVYGAEDQRKILELATERFAQAMGFRPNSICVGYASTNDHTYGVLYDLGYRHGMCSIPTRVLPECASVHAAAPQHLHYANPHNRVLEGDLDFVNIPVTVDPDSRLWGGKHPQDLRVELVDAKNHFYTIQKSLRRQRLENSPIRYLQGFTHNIFEFGKAEDFRRETLVGIIAHIKRLADADGLKVIGVTNAETASTYRHNIPRGSISRKSTLDRSGYLKKASQRMNGPLPA